MFAQSYAPISFRRSPSFTKRQSLAGESWMEFQKADFWEIFPPYPNFPEDAPKSHNAPAFIWVALSHGPESYLWRRIGSAQIKRGGRRLAVGGRESVRVLVLPNTDTQPVSSRGRFPVASVRFS
jgi:hypothetical protein